MSGYIKEHISKLSRLLTGGSIYRIQPNTVVETATRSPTWIESIQSADTDGEYYFILDDTETPLEVSTEVPFEQLDLRLVTNEYDFDITISCDCMTDSGTEFQQEFRIDSTLRSMFMPVTLQFDEPIVDLKVETSGLSSRESTSTGLLKQTAKNALYTLNYGFDEREYRYPNIELGTPVPRYETGGYPIVVVTVDSMPRSCLDLFQPLIDSLGDGLFTPSEPRTQGVTTPPAHASLFTGVHPGVHLHSMYHSERKISPELTTLADLLYEAGYKCSATNTHTRVLPEFGFGRGFHRYNLDRMDSWITRKTDVRTQVKNVKQWLDHDYRDDQSNRLFYFMHVYDPHSPYLQPPPYRVDERFSVTDYKKLRSRNMDTPDGYTPNYMDYYESGPVEQDDLYAALRRRHRESGKFVANQLVEVVEKLKHLGLFEESLIIVTADHGEEFGERGFYAHHSLYDENIRPMTLIKPPESVALNQKSVNHVNHIDILPTIATMLDVDVPDQCQGEPLQSTRTRDTRITERIGAEYYNVSIEKDEMKGIFTYEENNPNRPSEAQRDEEPVLEEFYHASAVREGTYEDKTQELSSGERDEFRSLADEFMRETGMYSSDFVDHRPAAETEERLENLGYL